MTLPNRATARRLTQLPQTHLELANHFGIYCVERHCACGKPYHYKRAPDGNVIIGPDGDFIRYDDPSYYWACGWLRAAAAESRQSICSAVVWRQGMEGDEHVA